MERLLDRIDEEGLKMRQRRKRLIFTPPPISINGDGELLPQRQRTACTRTISVSNPNPTFTLNARSPCVAISSAKFAAIEGGNAPIENLRGISGARLCPPNKR